MYLLFEALRLIGAVLEQPVLYRLQTIIKYSLFGHLLPIKEKHVR